MNQKTRFNYGYVVVAAATIIILVGFGTYYSYSVFFDPLLNEFSWTRAQTSGAFSLATLVSGSLGILAGRISDRLGPKIICISGGLFLGVGYILMSLVNATWQVYLLYGILLAIGISGLWPAAVSTVTRWFVEKRGLMTGIVTAGNGIGTVIFSPLLSHLISSYNWRLAYVITGIITAVFIVLAALFLKRKTGLIHSASNERRFSGTAAATGDFTFRQALRARPFWILISIYFLFGYAQFSLMVHIVPYAINLGISPIASASVLAVIGASSILGRLITGAISDRIDVKLLFTVNLILLLISLVILEFSQSLWPLYVVSLLFGLAYGGNSTSQSLVTVQLFGLASLGTLVGTFVFGVCLGGSIGPVITGFLFDVSGSYGLAFAICIMAAIITLILNFSLTSHRKDTRGQFQSIKGDGR